MAHFYGKLDGSRGQATRCGTKKSGMQTVAASWSGAVRVTLYEHEGEDRVIVSLIPWHGHGTDRQLYEGPVSGAP